HCNTSQVTHLPPFDRIYPLLHYLILLSSYFSFFQHSDRHQYLHSFPTRRSSDLILEATACPVSPRRGGVLILIVAAVCDRRNRRDRKSTRLNSSHVSISYAVFCLKKKKLQ